MSAVAVVTFSHDGLSPADIRALEEAERLISSRTRRQIEDAIAIGRELHDAKQLLGHGRFSAWVAATFQFSQRTAQNFMAAADVASKCAIVSLLDLPPTLIYSAAALPYDRIASVFAPREDGDPEDLETTVKQRITAVRRDLRGQPRVASEDGASSQEPLRQIEPPETVEADQQRHANVERDLQLRQHAEEAARIVLRAIGGDLLELQSLLSDADAARFVEVLLVAKVVAREPAKAVSTAVVSTASPPVYVETREQVEADAQRIADEFFGGRG